ncbi:hypothetical protein D3C78_1449830 [compost metagenome]
MRVFNPFRDCPVYSVLEHQVWFTSFKAHLKNLFPHFTSFQETTCPTMFRIYKFVIIPLNHSMHKLVCNIYSVIQVKAFLILITTNWVTH